MDFDIFERGVLLPFFYMDFDITYPIFIKKDQEQCGAPLLKLFFILIGLRGVSFNFLR